MAPNTCVATFYGGHHEPGSRRRLGDDFKTIAKYVEHKANTTPTYKMSDLSQSDRHILFSSARGEFKLGHSADGVVRMEYVEERSPVDGMDPDLAAMLRSTNYYQSWSKTVDGYLGSLDKAIGLAEQDACYAYAFARDLSDGHDTAENKAKETYAAGFRKYSEGILPGRIGMRNPYTVHPLPIHVRDAKIIYEGSKSSSLSDQVSTSASVTPPSVSCPKVSPFARSPVSRLAGFSSFAELPIAGLRPFPAPARVTPEPAETSTIGNWFKESPIGFSDSSPVSSESSSAAASSNSSPKQDDLTNPDLVELPLRQLQIARLPTPADEAEVDGGGACLLTGHLGAGLMEQFQTREPFDGNSGDFADQRTTWLPSYGLNMYSMAYPELFRQARHFGQDAGEVQHADEAQYEVTETAEHAVSNDSTALVLYDAGTPTTPSQADDTPNSSEKGSAPVTPPSAYIPSFSPSTKSEKLQASPNSPWRSIICYEVPPATISRLFPENFILPAYWTSRADKARYLRHRISQMKYNDTKFRQHPQFGLAARQLIHVFVDMSNILIGFWDTLKKLRGMEETRRIIAPPLSFNNLSKLMIRDRTADTRCVVGSHGSRDLQRIKELMETAEALKYKTMLLQRVPASGARRQYEQGVDEILHLKMLQSLLDHTGRPATMVLATGDAKSAQYSDGFKRYVERALDLGWNVELYAWRKGFSKEWEDAIFVKRWGLQFKVFMLDEWVEELLDITIESIQAAEASQQ